MTPEAIQELAILLGEHAREECGHLPGCRPCSRCVQAAIAQAAHTVQEHWRAKTARIASELASAANR